MNESLLANLREKRVKRAIHTAREAARDGSDLKLQRFHRAMDDLRSRDEGEAVYYALRDEGWYRMAAQVFLRTP